jgi:hypothetical protein
LKGDPEHAGVQYRPANEVEKKKTKYLFPNGVTQVKGVKDLPWAAENYTLGGKEYGVGPYERADQSQGNGALGLPGLRPVWSLL